MEDRALKYFSSVNPIGRKIIKDEVYLRNAIGEQWKNLDLKQQEDLIDDFIVDVKIREIYASVEKADSYPLSFPKLKVDTGERINVEFEDDCWTWQDEHSSPFNWRSKSQQDLTLDDLEPEALGKPVTKGKKKDSDTQQPPEPTDANVKLAPQEFTVQSAGSIWDSPFLQGVKKPEFLNRSRSASPTKSTSASRDSLTTRSQSPEEVNYGFTGSVDDLSSSHSLREGDRSMSVSSGEVLNESPSHAPIKPKRRRSFSKSPIKSVLSGSKKSDPEQYSEVLVPNNKDEEHAFDNPAVGNEWSSFVNESPPLEPSSAASSPSKRLLKEPEPISMDRGDHSTDDLRSDFDGEDEFHDEVLVVEVTDNNTKAFDEPDAMNTSSMSKTGFDFLDDW